jgi:hypothetical protein
MAIIDALGGRPSTLEEEILRLTKLAAQEREAVQQDNYSRLAEDLQRDARG